MKLSAMIGSGESSMLVGGFGSFVSNFIRSPICCQILAGCSMKARCCLINVCKPCAKGRAKVDRELPGARAARKATGPIAVR